MTNLAIHHAHRRDRKEHAIEHEVLQQVKLQEAVSDIGLALAVDFVDSRNALLRFAVTQPPQVIDSDVLVGGTFMVNTAGLAACHRELPASPSVIVVVALVFLIARSELFDELTYISLLIIHSEEKLLYLCLANALLTGVFHHVFLQQVVVLLFLAIMGTLIVILEMVTVQVTRSLLRSSSREIELKFLKEVLQSVKVIVSDREWFTRSEIWIVLVFQCFAHFRCLIEVIFFFKRNIYVALVRAFW